MDQVKYNNLFTKKLIKDSMYLFMYGTIKQQMLERLDSLVTRNTVISVYPHKSYTYKGVLYNCDITRPPRNRQRLIPQLHGAMDEYLEDYKRLYEEEIPYVIGFINQVLNASNSISDYLRVFPESVHPPIMLITSFNPKEPQLSDEQIKAILQQNQLSINLMKERMLLNLLI